MAKRLTLTDSDYGLVQEAVLYMGKRFFAPADTMALSEVEEKLDQLRRQGSTAAGMALNLDDQQEAVLSRALLAYAEELNHPASDASNRARARRLQQLGARPAAMTGFLKRIRNWLTGSR